MSSTHSGRHIHLVGKDRHLAGWRRDRPDHRDALLSVTGTAAAVFPSTVDNSNICSAVEDQGDLGSCVANASTSAMEALRKKEGRHVVNLSRLFLYYYTRKSEGTPPTEDSGCTLRNAMKMLVAFGTCPEANWPYDIAKFSTAPSYAAIKSARSFRVLRYYRCSNLLATRRSLADGFTVVGGFSVPETIYNVGPDGIVPIPAADTPIVGGHAIHFVGYDDSMKLLKFQNSWGTSFGNKGFGYLPYWYVENGMADDFWTIRNET
jgi:C1A family cysteine protease